MTETQSDVDAHEVAEWFGTLYRGSQGYLHIANSGNWTGRFFDISAGYIEAAEYVERLGRSHTSGIYARVTTLRQRPEQHKRGGAALSASLPALWADLDFDHSSHKHVACAGGPECTHLNDDGQRKHAHRILPLPPDEVAAADIVADSDLPHPTLWVNSGGGLYPLWLIEPVHQIWDLRAAEQLSTEWQRAIATAAQRAGWHYGTGVGDLARVLRIPGTWNRKTDQPRPCRIMANTDVRYRLSEMAEAAEQARQRRPAPPVVPRKPAQPRVNNDVRPGDDFSTRVDWSDPLLLGKLGWEVITQDGQYREWLRADHGATSTLSGTTGRDGLDNLYVFSTETPFPTNEPISKFKAFQIIHGHATYTDAARALNQLGFGSPPVSSVPLYRAALEPLDWPVGSTAQRPLPASPNGSHPPAGGPAEGSDGPPMTEPDGGAEREVDPLPRRIVLTPASAIKPRRVRWGWKDGEYGRCPVGEITLVPGREGVGKSLMLAWLIANITRGTLPGEFHGVPRPVLYSTAEDSWEHTVVPRLIAAEADVSLVYRVEVEVHEVGRSKLILPRDCRQLAMAARDMNAAALLLDPIISLIDDELSVNQSRQLRIALEPLRDAAERAEVMVIALAHFNKMSDTDILSKIPGARAWVEVARAAIALAQDGEEGGQYVASQVKNNLGRLDAPHLTYRIDQVWIDTDEGPATADTGKLVWTGTTPIGVDQILDRKRDKGKSGGGEDVEYVLDRYAETGALVPMSDVMQALPHRSESAIRQALVRAVNKGILERPIHGHYKPAGKGAGLGSDE